MRDFANGQAGIWLQTRAAQVSFAVALSPAFAWMSPFGTTDGSLFERLAFWGGLLSCWFVILAMTEDRLLRIPRMASLSPAAARVASFALAGLPMIAVAGFAAGTVEGWRPSAPKIAELYAQILVIGIGVTALWKAIAPTPRPAVSHIAQSGEAPSDAAKLPPLAARLPAAIRAPLLCLEMEDHYVRVHTLSGSALLLLRLGDAMAEAGATPGRQVHRSWWVADAAVEGFERRGRTGLLHLRGGGRVPVSRPYVREVEAAFGPGTSST